MASHSFFFIVAIGMFLSFIVAGVESVGVCYSTRGKNLPSPGEVIDLYKSNNIKEIRLYEPNQDALQALKGSNISVILGVPESDISSLASNPAAASTWVQTNIHAFSLFIKFRYIVVGNQLIPGANAKNVLPAMRNVQRALQSFGLQDKIKVSTAVSMSVLGASYPPSAGAFTSDALTYLQPVIAFLNAYGGPLLANVYPYISYSNKPNDISLEYALFTSRWTVVLDGQLHYQNIFDATMDALYWALEKVGGSGVTVVVSESGWPSDGGLGATIQNAQMYVLNLMSHIAGGTPKKPGRIETYIYAMFDDNTEKPRGAVNHYGLFTTNKQPKYKVIFLY